MSRGRPERPDTGRAAREDDGWRRELAHFSDLRLLVPALAGWALLATTLAFSARVAVAVSAVLLVAAVGTIAVNLRRGGGRPHARAARVHGVWSSSTGPVLMTIGIALTLQTAALGHVALRGVGELDELAASRASVTVLARVTSDPRVPTARADREPMVMLSASAREVTGRGVTTSAHGPLAVRGDSSLQSLRWHELVELRGRLGPPDPGRPDVAVLRVSDHEVVAPAGHLARAAEHLRQGLRDAVDPTPADARGLLPGLVIGDTSRTPEDLTEAMQATGMTHLTAVSGSNIAIVGGMVLGLCVLLGVPRRGRPWVVAVAILCFVVLARPEPSVVRAATMGLIGLIGVSRSRRTSGLPVLAGAIVVVLVLDPWMARSFGFALSALATLGLLLFTRPWGDAIGRHLPRRLAFMGPAIAIPVAAQAMCAPLIVLLQGSVSIVGVLANLVAAPLVAPATVAGVAAAVVSVVADAPARLIGWVGALPTLGIASTARFMADVPGGTMPWPDGALGAVLLAGVTLLLVLTGRGLARVALLRPIVALAVVSLAVATLLPTRVVTWPPDGWLVTFCDVGQGDAAVVRTGPRSALVIDAGPDPPPIDGCLDALHVSHVDAVVLTHFHADHVEGLPGVIDGRTVGQVLTSPIAEPAWQVDEVMAWAGADGIPVSSLAAGDTLHFGDATARVWAPVRRIASGSVPNNASVVLAVQVGEARALFLGDVEREAAHDLLLRMRRDAEMASAAAQFDVVKTPHHGSANLDAGLMEAVRAPVAVVSVGEGNDYGHPTSAHLEMLRRNGYAVRRTDRHGHVALVDRGDGLEIVTSR